MRKRVMLAGVGAIAAIGTAGWIGVKSLFHSTPEAERSEQVTRGAVEIKVVENGVIEPLKKVEVKSKVGGRIAKLLVDEGQTVSEGQALALIDPQEINSQVDALRAQLKGAEARLASARKNATYQKSQTTSNIEAVLQSVSTAQARLRSAEAENSVQPRLTEQSVQIAAASLESARANLKALQDNQTLMIESTHPNAVVSAQSAYDQAKAQADNAGRNLARQRKLLHDGFVSQQVVDAAETDAGVAESHTREVKDRLDRIQRANSLEENGIRNQVASSQSQVHQLEVALEASRTTVAPLTRRNDLASARAAYRQAVAQLDAARSGKTQDAMRGDDVRAAEAEVSQIQNQLNENLVHQEDTTLRAAMAGVVTRRYVEEGDLITSAIGSFSAGTPVFQVSDMATMLIKININEVDIPRVKVGLLTEVALDSARGVLFPAVVRKVATSALSNDTPGQQSGQGVIRFPVEIRVNRPDPRLKPGMSARCAIIVARRTGVLRLPTNCVQASGGKASVLVVTTGVKDGKSAEIAVKRDVTTGLRGDDFLEVTSGVKEGERVRPNPFNGPSRKTIDINVSDSHGR